MMKKLTLDFYTRKDVIQIARYLIGKILVTHLPEGITSGRIVETEAYMGLTDRASHSFGGRRTARNEHMYASGGSSYVYICYGMHQMFNVVTNEKDVPDAVLVRALEPLEGVEIMLKRTGKKKLDYTLTRGPGNLGKALGIHKGLSGLDLRDDRLFIADDGFNAKPEDIVVTKRIGVEPAGKDALLPYRFILRNNKYVSARKS